MFTSGEREALKMTIRVLVEEVEYLRSQLIQRPPVIAYNPPQQNGITLNPSNQPPMMSGYPAYVPEQEAELRELFADGHIDEDELDAALQTLGLGD